MSTDSEPEIHEDGAPRPKKSGLLFALGMVLALTLLVYLNMG
jgi:hypothetical protein